MKNKLSVKRNQDLLSKCRDVRYKGGVQTDFDSEKALLKSCQGQGRFMGVIPLQCEAGAYFYLNLGDDHVAEQLFWFGAFGYERASVILFTYLAKTASVVLDLDAYTGYYSILAATFANNSNIVAVEANPLNFHRLTENFRLNGIGNISINRAIVPADDSSDVVDICYNASIPVLDTGSYVDHVDADLLPQKASKKDFFHVQTTKISDIFEQAGWVSDDSVEAPCVLVKLDVEGLEAPLIDDILLCVGAARLFIFVEILTEGAYLAIVNSLTIERDDLSLLYIDEYRQELSHCESKSLERRAGSRNFIIARKTDVDMLLSICINGLLETSE